MLEMEMRNLSGIRPLYEPEETNEQVSDEQERELIHEYKMLAILFSCVTPSCLFVFYVCADIPGGELDERTLNYLWLFCTLWELFAICLAGIVMFHHASVKHGGPWPGIAGVGRPLFSTPQTGKHDRDTTFEHDLEESQILVNMVDIVEYEDDQTKMLDSVKCIFQEWGFGTRYSFYQGLYCLVCVLNLGSLTGTFYCLCRTPYDVS